MDDFDPTTARGIRLDVLRPARRGDSTLGGVSSAHNILTLVGVVDERGTSVFTRVVVPLPLASQVAAPSDDQPAVLLIIRRVGNLGRIVNLVPAAAYLAGRRGMAGGNYAAADTGGYSSLTEMYGAVAIHDRYEH